jgi:streptomycin 6-kinase
MVELQIPDGVVQMNIAANGEAGRAWLQSLPGMVEEVRARWGITVGPAFQGGVVGFVAPALRSDGERVVLKISFVDEETRNEADALELWDGNGTVRLLDADRDRGALLLERLEPGTSLEAHADRDEAVSIACGLLKRLWRPVPGANPFTPVADLALRWADELPERFEELGEPFEPSLLQRAVASCLELAATQEEEVLANRDYHLGNVLAASREPWLLIDPKPLVGERAFDTGHLVRSLLPLELEAREAARLIDRLAAELDLDAERIRVWAFVRSVENALWGLAIGDTGAQWDIGCARTLARTG